MLSQSALCHRVDQQREGHHHQQPFDPAGLFDKQRGDKKQRVFEKPKAPFNPGLAFVGRDDLGIAQLAGVDIGAKHKAGLDLLAVPHRLLIRPDVGLDLPRAGLEGRARCGTAFAGIAFVFDQVEDVDPVIRPALGQRRQGLLGRLGRVESVGLAGERVALVMASSSRCLALVSVASARSKAACEYTTSQRWAMP